jgi:UDP-glucose 4-epimerase
VQVNLLACEAPDASGLVFNIGTGGRFTLNHTLKLLEKFSAKPIKPKYEAPREGDIRDSQADISLARKILGYDPKVGFEEGLRRTWEWYKSTHTK